MSKEFKGYNITATPRPAKWTSLLTTVAIRTQDGKPAYCYISFSDQLVKAVLKKMPRGISPLDPAYLSVEWRNGAWEVWARYAQDDTGVIMWISKNPPVWLKFFHPKAPPSQDRKP